MAESFHCLFQLIEDCIYIHDLDGHFIAVNKAVEKMYGYSPEHYIGKTPADFAAPGLNDLDKIKLHWQKCLEGEAQRFEFWTQTANGHVYPKEVIINPGVYSGEQVIIAVSRDITNHKRLEEKLRDLADKDPLTGLYNRRVFFELANKSLQFSQRYQQPISLVMIDIDHFKKINDTFGHPIGDKVLVEFSDLLSSSARKSDILARFGGEEFVVLMPNTAQDNAVYWVKNFRQELDAFCIDAELSPINITVSVGIATNQEGGHLDELIRIADSALYHSKNSGRNKFSLA